MIVFGAAIGGKRMAVHGIISKGSRQPYQPNQGAIGNMGELFKQSRFGKQTKCNPLKNIKIHLGQSVYKSSYDTGDNIHKGDQFYLDAEHKNHLGVSDKRNNFVHVLNLHGNINIDKTKKAAAEGGALPK